VRGIKNSNPPISSRDRGGFFLMANVGPGI
jgi:hypothetical protein